MNGYVGVIGYPRYLRRVTAHQPSTRLLVFLSFSSCSTLCPPRSIFVLLFMLPVSSSQIPGILRSERWPAAIFSHVVDVPSQVNYPVVGLRTRLASIRTLIFHPPILTRALARSKCNNDIMYDVQFISAVAHWRVRQCG